MASKYWIKLYHEILDDPKMGRMPDRLWRRTIEIFLLAGEIDEEGVLPEVRDMAWRLRLSDDGLADDLSLLETYKIVHQQNGRYVVTKFADRQSPMTSAERTRRYRENEKHDEYETVHYGKCNEQCDETVTNRYTDTYIDIDTDTDTDIKGVKRPPLLIAFEAVTKIYQPAEMIEPKGFMLWEKEINKWEGMGVTKADIEAAVEKADELKTNLSWPGSITKYMESAIARRKRGVNGDKSQSADTDRAKLLEEVWND